MNKKVSIHIKKSILVRGLEISPPIALAPMVGLSHSAFRSLVQKQGGVGLLFTEMLTARRLPHDNDSCSPLLIRHESERPLIYQIIAATKEVVGPAVEKIHQLGAQGIDLNLGCPAPMQRRQGAGAALADNREQLAKMLRALRKGTELPVSVKIRLGARLDSGDLRSFCLFLEDQGVDMITIHARLKGEKFCRKPRWAAIGQVVNDISVPVFANGGIFSTNDARRCLELSGADGLMVGRGAVERPWLCADIARQLYQIKTSENRPEKKDIYADFVLLLEERFAPERRLGRLKQFTRYFASTYKFGHQLATSVQNSDTIEEASERAGAFFARYSC